jgi:hypothetical protein
MSASDRDTAFGVPSDDDPDAASIPEELIPA